MPPLPPHPSSSFGQKSPLKSSSLGEGISGSPSLAMILGKSTLLPSDMNLRSSLSNVELVSTGVQHYLLVRRFLPPYFFYTFAAVLPSFLCYFRDFGNG